MDRLQRKQAAIRNSIDKTIATANELLQASPAAIGELEELFDLLIQQSEELRVANENVEKKIDIDQLDEELASCSAYSTKISSMKTILKRAIKMGTASDIAPAVSSQVNTSSTSNTQSSAPASSTTSFQSQEATTRLPKLEIAKFNGDVRSWPKFWNEFESTIHKNSALPAIDKFKYLSSYLTGRAAAAIEGLTLTDRNYEIAVKTLLERFGKDEVIIEDHMSRLLSIRPVLNVEETGRLRMLYDEIQAGVRSLEALGVPPSGYGVLLLTVLRKSIPKELRLEYCRRKTARSDGTEDELLSFLDFLRNEIESRERAEYGTCRFQESHSPRNKQNRMGNDQKQASSSVLSAFADKKENACAFCKARDHLTADCQAGVSLEQKSNILKQERRCFKCTKRNHRAAECRTAKWLTCAKCSARHATALCGLNNRPAQEPSSQVAAPPAPAAESSLQVAATVGAVRIMLQTAQVWAEGPHERSKVRLLLDGGSQRTFVKQELSRRLKLRVLGEEKLTIMTFGNERPTEQRKCRRVELWLRNQHSGNEVRVEALEVPVICCDVIPAPEMTTVAYLNEQGMEVADCSVDGSRLDEVGLLLGADYYWEVATGNIKRLQSGLVAVETVFGWTLQGSASTSSSAVAYHASTGVLRVTVSADLDDDNLSKQLKSFWELEHIGITDKPDNTHTEKQVLQDFKENVAYKDGRYCVALPWQENIHELADNKTTALARLSSLTTKLLRSEGTAEAYDRAMRDYLLTGHAEEVPEAGESPRGPVYYMPHRGVTRPSSETTKLRVVFDASSSAPGQRSLNEVLSAGPNLNPNLSDILIRFRMHNVAIMADIEKAFLQVGLAEMDRDALRFLWYESVPRRGEVLPPIKEYRMTRVPFGVTSSPFLLAATLKHHLDSVHNLFPATSEMLRDHLYVDDLVTGADNLEEAEKICRESQEIMQLAGMNLRKWKSNEFKLEEALSETDRTQSGFSDVTMTKILGVEWRPESDDFVFEMNTLIDFLSKRQDTKRFLLQASARVFDPFGFLAPISTTAKVMFQSLWERGTDWDESLPPDIAETWDKWCHQLPMLRQIATPRLLARDLGHACTEVELHVFCDASPKAYGAVAYVKARTENGCTTVTLLMAKARVAPLKRLSLPRLELMGAVIGARLAKNLTKQLGIEGMTVHCWTDSTIALSWIKSSASKWKPFVSNRVQEIQQLTNPAVWKHCPGKENPADILTRGILPSVLVNAKQWWEGPEWLNKSKTYPAFEPCLADPQLWQEEIRTPVLNTITDGEPAVLINLSEKSSLTRVLRTTAWIKRFLYNCRTSSEKRMGSLSAEEMTEAERYWLRISQMETFGNEVRTLSASKPLDRKSPIKDLNPFLDNEGLLRVGGRLQNSTEQERTIHPIILSARHPYAGLLIRGEHKRLLHAGVRDTLSHLRENYWIIRARQAVKSAIRRCVPCQRQSCRPAAEAQAPLPADRVTQADPFEVTGVDFAGPIFYTDQGSMRKSYIALFTCATTRAVHLELVRDLTTETFLMALRRFIARRGIPKTVYSDNALTFKRASADMNKIFHAIKGSDTQAYLSDHRITWKFIVERAAWWGGFWERMVRTVKNVLRKVLGRSALDYDSIVTILTQAEAVVNSRPLTYVHSQAEELTPLTPSHLLIGRRLTSLPSPGGNIVTTSTKSTVTRQSQRRSALMDLFWRRWRREYLLELRSAHFAAGLPQKSVKEGDIVLLGEDKTPRQLWKLCRVVETFPGRDGKARACRIVLPNKKELRRPVQALYPLEL